MFYVRRVDIRSIEFSNTTYNVFILHYENFNLNKLVETIKTEIFPIQLTSLKSQETVVRELRFMSFV